MSQDKMSQDKTLQDKMSRTYRRGQNVADKLLRTKCCMDKMLQGQNVAKKMSHGQIVARTKCCMDKMLQRPNVAKKTLSHEQMVSQNKKLCEPNGARIFR
jgi:hypothetical protein